MLTDYKVDINDEAKLVAERINNENLYQEFVSSQEQGFFRVINYINSVINRLKQQKNILPEIRARIKDTDSALKNHSNDRLLDDVFGVEIICRNEKEKRIIKKELEKTFRSTRTKTHRKDTGYKAEHESYSIKYNDSDIDEWRLKDYDVPAVECQFKTTKVADTAATHHDYKKVCMQEIQKKLESTTLQVGKEIPRMWILKESGIVELSYKDIIQRVYPFVDVTTIKEPEKDLMK